MEGDAMDRRGFFSCPWRTAVRARSASSPEMHFHLSAQGISAAAAAVLRLQRYYYDRSITYDYEVVTAV